MSYKSLDTSRFHWCWKQYGTGEKLLLAFHGFNRSPDDFHSFERWLGNDYTILAFDLFFHGKSLVKGDERKPAFTRDELKEALLLILNQYGKREFEVVAYSFGGRLALNCVEIMGEKVKGLYLMAPDAMRFNPGYWFTSQTKIGNLIMQRYNQDPSPVLRFMKLLSDLGFYNPKAMEVFMNHIRYEPVRQKVSDVWMAHRLTFPKRRLIYRIIKRYQIPVLLFFGRYDTIIPPRLGKRFERRAGKTTQLHILEIGHRLPEKHAEICGIISSLQGLKMAEPTQEV